MLHGRVSDNSHVATYTLGAVRSRLAFVGAGPSSTVSIGEEAGRPPMQKVLSDSALVAARCLLALEGGCVVESESFNETAVKALEAIAGEVEDLRRTKLGSNGEVFDCVLRAAFAKSYDFARSAFGEREDGVPFFVLGTLRGIVEDIIVLATLTIVEESRRDMILSLWMKFNVEDDMVRQRDFFAADGRGQVVLARSGDEARSEAKSRLAKSIADAGLDPGRGTGNMREWAVRSGLLSIYEFHYAAASRLVHFSPGVLLRTGWGESADPDADWTFRVTNFGSYYDWFYRIWSCDLLAHFVRKLGAPLGVSPALAERVREIEAALKRELRLPELVTFEEMNLQPPAAIWQIAARVTAEIADDPGRELG